MENLISFNLENVGNWTGASLLSRISQENRFRITHTKYGQKLLNIKGGLYAYDHVESIESSPLTVYLRKIEVAPSQNKYEVHILAAPNGEILIVEGFQNQSKAKNFFQSLPYGHYADFIKISPEGQTILESNY